LLKDWDACSTRGLASALANAAQIETLSLEDQFLELHA